MFKRYQNIIPMQAKLFQMGDQDGFTSKDGDSEWYEDYAKEHLDSDNIIPYIKESKPGQRIGGRFGECYICLHADGTKQLIKKEIFEKTYQLIDT